MAPDMRTIALMLLAALPLMAGCSNFSYYLQSVEGQMSLLQKRHPIVDVLADPATPPTLKSRLERVLTVRDFASRELLLPDNQSYRSYADLERPYVVWNVFAAAEFSVKPEQWCFPVAGCVEYRGYFAQAKAEELRTVRNWKSHRRHGHALVRCSHYSRRGRSSLA